MEKYKKTILVTFFVTLLPIAVGLLLWNQLPEQLATHFSMNGTPDGWSSKAFAVFGLPLLLAGVHLICIVATLNDPKKQNIGKKMLTLVFWIIPVLSCVVNGSVYALALGVPVNIASLTYVLIGFSFLFLGNYMPKNHQNYTVGIRLPWTLNSKENWNRTHRFASRLWMLAGIVIILNGLFQFTWLLLPVILVMVALPMIYSFILHKKGI